MTNEQKIEAAKLIQAMIEAVDPADSAVMDEIDARVWCLLGVQGFTRERYRVDLSFDMLSKIPDGYAYINHFNSRKIAPKYTRSIDAQQPILDGELKGWGLISANNDPANTKLWVCIMGREISGADTVEGPTLSTEPLARLHAILSALIWTWGDEI